MRRIARSRCATHTLRVPQPIAHGSANAHSFIVLEYLELNPRGNAALLGERLAALHHCTGKNFGFAQDNFIGTTPQPNGWKDDWMDFWREHRLGFQLRLAAQYGGRLQMLGKKLLDALPAFFSGYTPVVFDPAPYYGDRECDLAMTELFGGGYARQAEGMMMQRLLIKSM
jgi:fructosamine-3-kinase